MRAALNNVYGWETPEEVKQIQNQREMAALLSPPPPAFLTADAIRNQQEMADLLAPPILVGPNQTTYCQKFNVRKEYVKKGSRPRSRRSKSPLQVYQGDQGGRYVNRRSCARTGVRDLSALEIERRRYLHAKRQSKIGKELEKKLKRAASRERSRSRARSRGL